MLHTHTTMSQNIIDFLFTATHVGVLHSWCSISYCSELDVVEMDTKGLSNFNKGKVIIAICQGQSDSLRNEAAVEKQCSSSNAHLRLAIKVNPRKLLRENSKHCPENWFFCLYSSFLPTCFFL